MLTLSTIVRVISGKSKKMYCWNWSPMTNLLTHSNIPNSISGECWLVKLFIIFLCSYVYYPLWYYIWFNIDITSKQRTSYIYIYIYYDIVGSASSCWQDHNMPILHSYILLLCLYMRYDAAMCDVHPYNLCTWLLFAMNILLFFINVWYHLCCTGAGYSKLKMSRNHNARD